MIKRLFICSATLALLVACAEDYYSSQYPAPIYGGQPDMGIPRPPYPYPEEQQPRSQEGVETKPLKEYVPEPRPLPDELPKRHSNRDSTHSRNIEDKPRVTGDSDASQQITKHDRIPEEKVEELPPLEQSTPTEAAPTEQSQAETEYKPLESNESISKPVDALVLAAKEDSAGGNLESAGASIERAIRIKPRNANLYYRLAVIRLEQFQPRLAEDLAKKAALLASDDNTLKKHSWLLIARARELQNNPDGAEAARKKANNF